MNHKMEKSFLFALLALLLFSPGGFVFAQTASSTPADLIIYNADIYPFIFIGAIIVFFLAFWITLKA